MITTLIYITATTSVVAIVVAVVLHLRSDEEEEKYDEEEEEEKYKECYECGHVFCKGGTTREVRDSDEVLHFCSEHIPAWDYAELNFMSSLSWSGVYPKSWSSVYPTKRALTYYKETPDQRVNKDGTPYEEEKHACDICGEEFEGKNNLNGHMKAHNGKNGLIPCGICGQMCRGNRGLGVHKGKTHPNA